MFTICSLEHLLCMKNKRYFYTVTLCIFVLWGCSACTSRSIYLDKSFNPSVYFGRHVVRSGDTLYSIAWRYGRELKELAQANNIESPYVIVPGQKINLEKVGGGRSLALSGDTKEKKSKRNVTEGKASVSVGKSVTKNKKHKKFKNIKWAWPYVGPILAKYSISKKRKRNQELPNKGLDIAGSIGAPIFAAATGEVVYAGGGLLGYGNLVIINHNEEYLSAYAHNKRILVKEGQKIRIGDKISEMGVSDKKQAMLHFEIRRNGLPVDPMKYLPER